MKETEYMKKVAVIFCAVFLAMLLPMRVGAVGISANPSSQTLQRGETVTFEAVLSESVTVGFGSVSLDYDKSVLKLTCGEWNISNAMITHFDLSKGLGAFAYSSTGEISGKIFSVTFQVLDTAPTGVSPVELKISLKDGENLPISVIGGGGDVTIVCNHRFTKVSTDGRYLKTPASCIERAVYYYCCEYCGAAGSETFEYGEPLGHIGGTVTTVSRAICSRCGSEYGGFLQNETEQTTSDMTYTFTEERTTETERSTETERTAETENMGTTEYTTVSAADTTGGTSAWEYTTETKASTSDSSSVAERTTETERTTASGFTASTEYTTATGGDAEEKGIPWMTVLIIAWIAIPLCLIVVYIFRKKR